MPTEIIKAKVFVPLVGKPTDYVNLPIVKGDKAIGVITDAIKENDKYALAITLWQDVGLELLNGVPNAVTFNW